ncbi:TetR/AcrR family transcriptional regulator [Pseudoalteromonas fenneropenaei]|uniref:TetR/AcrR family transcriptional regulator n=1 Tax=Pseudoalteromonas fenneropenaei TaxID=1737459 RepID=A0ABV7CJB3_9GAMM
MKVSEKKRLQIINTAERLFALQGVAATSMDQVAAEAEVSKRTVYNHFATKTVLFQAVMTEMFYKIEQGAEVVFDPMRDISAQLTEIANQEVQLLTSDEFLKIAKIAFLQLLQDSELAQSLSNAQFGCLRYFERFLASATEQGVLRVTDFELAAKQFVYQLKSLIFYPALYGFEQITKAQQAYYIEETVKLFVARYGN